MRSKFILVYMAAIGVFAAVSRGSASADDPLNDAIKRIGYWHFHRLYTAVDTGSTKVENDFDRCIDLRNTPPPVPIRLPGWTCSNFKADKTATAYHFHAMCTFNNDGHVSTRTDMKLGRVPVYFQDTSANWLKPDGNRVQTHTVLDGKLMGACPAGVVPINLTAAAPSMPTTSLPMAHSH